MPTAAHPRPSRLRRGLVALALFAIAFTTGAGRASALDIAGPLTIDSGNKATYENQDIVVISGVITIATPITFKSLIVKSGGTITHPAGATWTLSLTVTNSATVNAGGAIDATGRGYPGDQGFGAGGSSLSSRGGGASYGGEGTQGHPGGSSGGTGGAVYGSVSAPGHPGSGGGTGSGNPGSAGGGVLHLYVGGTLTVNGFVSANGAYNGNTFGGAGSGGAVVVETGSLAGSGFITANGGQADNNAGAGGGGRVAVHYAGTNGMARANIRAAGGSSNWAGWAGAGTVLVKATSQAYGELRVHNAGNASGYRTVLTEAAVLDRVVVWGQGNLAAPVGGRLDVTTVGDFSIEVDGRVDVTGRGYGPDQGPGAGGASPTQRAGGGGHGGSGHYGYPAGTSGGTPGAVYGSIQQPNDFGSGGGTGSGDVGAYGGGIVRLTVGGTLSVAGLLYANGAYNNNTYGGAGGGGTIHLTVGTLSGTGFITASGGRADNNAGAGGGGRIAIAYSVANQMDRNRIQAAGGFGNWAGWCAAGTIFVKGPGQPNGELWIHNNGNASSLGTLLRDPTTFDRVVVWGAGILTQEPLAVLDLTVTGDCIVEGGARIDVTGRGYSSKLGPGAGGSSSTQRGGGGGHGGAGMAGFPGAASGGGAGGATYGSNTLPVDFGSGGGEGSGDPGSAGGGVIRLTVNGTLRVDGIIAADGAYNGSTYGGAGAGGSILLRAGFVYGDGSVRAIGGRADSHAGAGGGGRIAMYYSNATPPPASMFDAKGGGSNWNGNAAAGTLYMEQVAGNYTATLTLSASTLAGGQSAVGTVQLNVAAPQGGLGITLANSHPALLSMASGVTVPAGETIATFTVTAQSTTQAKTVTVSAQLWDRVSTDTVTVKPWLSSIKLLPTSVNGGSGSGGTVTLNVAAPVGGLTFGLSSSDASATVPASVTVPAGTKSVDFAIATTSVSAVKAAVISATYLSESKAATLYVNPGSLQVKSLTLSPASVVGGGKGSGIVTLTGVVPAGGVQIALASADSSVASVPAFVKVLQGKTGATFSITTKVVPTTTSVSITATLGVTKVAALTVRLPAVSSLQLVPSSVTGGETAFGIVTLDAAPTSPVVVTITSTRPDKAIPDATIVIPAGETTGTFSIDTLSVTSTVFAAITAKANDTTKTQVLTINP